MNDLPEPGLNDVMAMRLQAPSAAAINSTFVRRTRNDSGLDIYCAVVVVALLAFAFGILRNLTKERNSKVLDIVAATKFGVVGLFEVCNTEGYGKADEEGQAEYHRAPGRGGDIRRAGAVDDFGVVGGERLRELVLLTSLQ